MSYCPAILESYEEKKKADYMLFLRELGENIDFKSDIWICDKRQRSAADNRKDIAIYFSTIAVPYKEAVKFFAIISLINGRTISTVKSYLKALVRFFHFLSEQDEVLNLWECNTSTALKFKDYLDSKNLAISTKETSWTPVSTMFKIMDGWDNRHLKNVFYINPYISHKNYPYKYIPDDVVEQLDIVFKTKDIQLRIQCIYWILRLIPSRISEVLGMSIDCLKMYNGHYVLFIPTWKQNGGKREAIMRVIHLEDTGIATYLIGLIKRQQAVAKEFQSYMPQNKKDALFTYRIQSTSVNGNEYFIDKYNITSNGSVLRYLKQACEKYNVLDNTGSIYNSTSHQFRHNGITDRLEAGFTVSQIADMTGHHGNAMIYGAYLHLDLKPATIQSKQKYVLNEPEKDENPYVMFGGRILNMDEMLENRLLKNLRAHKVNGGICADITGCKNDMWNCLVCKYFVPDEEQLLYFEEQISAWSSKAQKFSKFPLIAQNALRNTNLFKRIVSKIKNKDGCINENIT